MQLYIHENRTKKRARALETTLLSFKIENVALQKKWTVYDKQFRKVPRFSAKISTQHWTLLLLQGRIPFLTDSINQLISLQPTNFSSTFNFKNVETVHILPESEIIAGKHRSKWTPCTQDKKLIICHCENYPELSLIFLRFQSKNSTKIRVYHSKNGWCNFLSWLQWWSLCDCTI